MIERFLELLIASTERIPAHYFQLPMARPNNGPEMRYRERVYCYEQLRVVLERDKRFNQYVLSGEVDKHRHTIIRRHIPDLILHVPGKMDNLVVVEVKPVNGSQRRIQEDYRTLEYFLSERVHYQHYGDDEVAFETVRETFRGFASGHFDLLWHRYQGRPAERLQLTHVFSSAPTLKWPW